MPKKFLVVAADGAGYVSAQSIAQEVKSELEKLGVIACLASETNGSSFEPDMVIAVGGDGTIMRAMKKFSPAGVPTFGINGGTLGFLAGAERDDWRESLARVITGAVHIEERLALSFTWRNQEFGPIANEVFMRHKQYPVKYRVAIDGTVFYDSIETRGFMVATATGSNAENASNFGTPIFPTSTDVALTPMNPQSPAVRSFAVPQIGAGGKVTVTFLPGKYEGMTVEVWADGNKYEIDGSDMQPGETLVFTRHPLPLLLVTFGLSQHIRALRKKGFSL